MQRYSCKVAASWTVDAPFGTRHAHTVRPVLAQFRRSPGIVSPPPMQLLLASHLWLGGGVDNPGGTAELGERARGR